MQLKKYTVTVRRFQPEDSSKFEEFALPVDSPDEEHAISAAMSNAVAFTPKYHFGSVKPIAFQCMGIETRG